MIPVTSGVDLTENQVPFPRRPWAKSTKGSTSSSDRRGRPSRPVPTRGRSPLRRQSQPTVRYWVERARGQRLDRVRWEDRRTHPSDHATHTGPDRGPDPGPATAIGRAERPGPLRCRGDLRALLERGTEELPSIRTIGRILRRRGALDGKRRCGARPRRPAGICPRSARRHAELDSIDIVEGLAIKDGPYLEVLNAVSLHGGLVGSWPHEGAGHGGLGRRGVDRALAARRPAELRPVRQRHDLHRAPYPPRHGRACHEAVPGPGGRARVRPAA